MKWMSNSKEDVMYVFKLVNITPMVNTLEFTLVVVVNSIC